MAIPCHVMSVPSVCHGQEDLGVSRAADFMADTSDEVRFCELPIGRAFRLVGAYRACYLCGKIILGGGFTIGLQSHVVLIGQVKQYFAYESRHQHGAFDMTGGSKYFLLLPLLGEDSHFDYSNIFQRG